MKTNYLSFASKLIKEAMDRTGSADLRDEIATAFQAAESMISDGEEDYQLTALIALVEKLHAATAEASPSAAAFLGQAKKLLEIK